ncbi:MAG TPA: hypothetical protein VHP11_12340 [Tepidisphaeraceae bacterium]|nr:hypothetical protein [Tepidisphaeraceae bacterium]
MKPGELKKRHRAKAIRLLDQDSFSPHFTTTEALCLIEAACGPARLHGLLANRGLAIPVESSEKGYDFALSSEFGTSTLSIGHHSFQWSLKGVAFIASILSEEGIEHEVPKRLLARLESGT